MIKLLFPTSENIESETWILDYDIKILYKFPKEFMGDSFSQWIFLGAYYVLTLLIYMGKS